MSKKQPPVDWRYRVVSTIAEDSVSPDGTVFKKGTPISVTTFIKHGDKSLPVGDPSAPALFLSQAHKAYEQALKIHPFVMGVPPGDESVVSERVYDYLELISDSTEKTRNLPQRRKGRQEI